MDQILKKHISFQVLKFFTDFFFFLFSRQLFKAVAQVSSNKSEQTTDLLYISGKAISEILERPGDMGDILPPVGGLERHILQHPHSHNQLTYFNVEAV